MSTLVRLAHMLFLRSEVGLGYLGRHVVNGNAKDCFWFHICKIVAQMLLGRADLCFGGL